MDVIIYVNSFRFLFSVKNCNRDESKWWFNQGLKDNTKWLLALTNKYIFYWTMLETKVSCNGWPEQR